MRNWNIFSGNNNTVLYALVGTLFGLMFPVAATLIRVYDSNLPLGLSGIVRVQASDSLLWIIDTAPFFLGLFAAYTGRRQDNLKKVNDELKLREKELTSFQMTLEQRVDTRTKELLEANQQIEKRAGQLQAISSVARTIASVQDLDELLPSVTRLVSEQFGYYHVGIFLLDENNQFAVLRAANSGGGQQMLNRQHKLRLDTNSIVGFVTLRGEPRIALDVGADSVYFRNPDLPDTKSEMALPLRIGDRVIGALDVQSKEIGAFTTDDINTLTTLTDQVAIAIENSRLFSETRQALNESQATFERYVKREWNNYTQQARNTGYSFDGRHVTPLDPDIKRIPNKSIAQTGRLSLEKKSATVAVPIKLRGETIGILDVRSKKGDRLWTQDEIAILEAAAERAGLALENARLVDSAQRRASRERAIGEISTKIGAVSHMEAILQTAVEELGRKIGGATEVILELNSDESGERT